MGYGSYSNDTYRSIKSSIGADSASHYSQVFNSQVSFNNTSISLNKEARQYNDIDSYALNTGVRECRDSEEHPITTPVIIAFDVTGSMGRIPLVMIKEQFPYIMDKLIESGVPSPQVCFMAVGDSFCDDAPIQVGQFEIDAEKLVLGLKSLWPESGGGGNGGESYSLAWIMAGNHTELDSWYKRNIKGFLFTIGDEPIHEYIPAKHLERFFGYEKGCPDISTEEALELAKKQYHVFHINCSDSNPHKHGADYWKQLLGENYLNYKSSEISDVIVGKVLQYMPISRSVLSGAEPEIVQNESNKIDDSYL